MSTPPGVVSSDHPNYPGTKQTVFADFNDHSGDAAYDDKEEIGVTGLIFIMFSVGIGVAALLFYGIYRCEMHRREREAQYEEKLPSSSRSTAVGSARIASGGEFYCKRCLRCLRLSFSAALLQVCLMSI